MTFWPIWVTPCSTSEMRYQHYVALAYGAQGLVCFAYTPNRPNWFVDQWNYTDAKHINKDEPPARPARVDFGPQIRYVELLGPVHAKEPALRRIEPAWSVPYELLAGEGIILGVDPPDIEKLLGDLAGPYTEIAEKTGQVRALLRQKEIDFATVE